MKKIYCTPTLDVVELKYSSPILTGSKPVLNGILFNSLDEGGEVEVQDDDMDEDDEVL